MHSIALSRVLAAIFCRIAVILVLNVDMLVLPTEANGLRTTQTRFYCQFGKKAESEKTEGNAERSLPAGRGDKPYRIKRRIFIIF